MGEGSGGQGVEGRKWVVDIIIFHCKMCEIFENKQIIITTIMMHGKVIRNNINIYFKLYIIHVSLSIYIV